MPSTNALAQPASPAAVATDTPGAKYSFFHPVVDFLCLGGGSIVLVLLIAASGIGADHDSRAELAAFTFVLAHLINHPHFAHSYQLFYRDYWNKVWSPKFSVALRARYAFAGILSPLLLAVFFAVTITRGDLALLGKATNLMGLLVGWHYVKQGYGVLIAVSVLKKQFFAAVEKNVLLVNAYSCWISFWLGTNWLGTQGKLWGIEYFLFHIPAALMVASLCVSALTSCLVIAMLVRKWGSSGALPFNGVVAYLTTLYLWLFLLTDPILVLVIPACHSLQYLVIVWRYRLNLEAGQSAAGDRKPYSESASFRFMVFLAVGMLLGYCGFWAFPEYLDATVAYDHGKFGPTLFLFVFWVFINVHHYFIDNVIWRRENPDTAKYLFNR